MNCCEQLFDDFQFADLRTANPPKQKGVYVIRIKQRGLAPFYRAYQACMLAQ